MTNNKHNLTAGYFSAIFVLMILLTNNVTAQLLTAESSNQSSPVIINSPRVWEDITSVTIPELNGANAVMVIANFESRVVVGNKDMSGKFQVTDYTNNSLEITKDLMGKQYSDIGMGAAVHIFNYSAVSGSMSFALQHLQSGGGNTRFASKGNLAAALELHRQPVRTPYDEKFSGDYIQNDRVRIEGNGIAYATSWPSQMIHCILNTQVNDLAFKSY